MTSVVSEGGARWFAAAVAAPPTYADTIRVYRLGGGRWRLDGTVAAAGAPSGLGRVAAAELTGGSEPDFVFSDLNGADWIATVVVAHLDGRWRSVPFESGRGFNTVIDARSVRGRLVMGEADGCGCAGGPETYVWYRFDGSVFVPTPPPGVAPSCTPGAADAATPLLGGLPGMFPWTPAQLGARVVVGRLQCADGWALATGTRNDKPVTALFEQSGSRWLRAGVGSIAQLNTGATSFALPLALLHDLQKRLGI